MYLHTAMEGDNESSRKQHEDINTKRKEVENTESVHQEIQAAVPKDVEVSSWISLQNIYVAVEHYSIM